ncbi:hypothetical protein [Xanthomonas phaseoli]|uniref:hypothetical protein n=1 Tax=Xanthomonas phaseoli TaxID=1985254 RepID=UPI003CE5857F
MRQRLVAQLRQPGQCILHDLIDALVGAVGRLLQQLQLLAHQIFQGLLSPLQLTDQCRHRLDRVPHCVLRIVAVSHR